LGVYRVDEYRFLFDNVIKVIDIMNEHSADWMTAIKYLHKQILEVNMSEMTREEMILLKKLHNVCFAEYAKTLEFDFSKDSKLLKEEPVKLKKYKIRTTIQGVRLISDEYYTDEEIKEMSLLWEKDLSTKIEE
jgi:hypothetical protein